MRRIKDKFGTHHFPVGTVFQLNEEMEKSHGPKLYAVSDKGLYRNAPNNYVAQTTEPDPRHPMTERFHCFALGHVKRIVWRGDGPVKIEHGWYGLGELRDRKRMAEDLDMMEIRAPLDGVMPRRGFYTTGSMTTVVMIAAIRAGKPDMLVKQSELIAAVMQQSWVQPIKLGFLTVHRVNKKRLRAWMRQNLNRYLLSMSQAQKEQDEEDRKHFEHDMGDVEDRVDAIKVPEDEQVADYSVFDDDRFEDYGAMLAPTVERVPRAEPVEDKPQSLGDLLRAKMARDNFYSDPKEDNGQTE